VTPLDQVIATHDIQQVLARYCRGMDRMDADLTLECFEPDAHLEYHGLYRGDPAGFVRWLWPVHASLVGHTHQIQNSIVDLVDGDDGAAVSEAYVTVTLRAVLDGELVDLIGRGRYLDEWTNASGRWAICGRRYVSDLTTVVSAGDRGRFSGLLTPAVSDPPAWRGARDTTDASYSLGSWRR
jgi:hypothetical protein